MGIAPDLITAEAVKTLDAVANNGRPQMADMHRFSHIRACIIHDHPTRCLNRFCAGADILCDYLCLADQSGIRQGDIQKPGACYLYARNVWIFRQPACDGGCDLTWVLTDLLGTSHRAIALKMTELGLLSPHNRTQIRA